MSIPTVSRFSNYLELRIKGMGETRKGDRTELLSPTEARKLAITLLQQAECLGSADKSAGRISK